MYRSIMLFLLLVACGSANAALVRFDWSGIVQTVNSTAGVVAGDTVSITVFADNGGSDLVDQVFNNADVIRGELTAGSYSATYFPPSSFGNPFFATNASGDVIQSTEIFCCGNPTSFDNAGGSNIVEHSRNAAITSTGSFFWEFPTYDTWDASQWTASLVGSTPVPAPLGGALLLGVAALLRRRR